MIKTGQLMVDEQGCLRTNGDHFEIIGFYSGYWTGRETHHYIKRKPLNDE